MFAGSSLTSLSSSGSSEHDDEQPVAGPSTFIRPLDGPFACPPDPTAVRYLKDTSAQTWLERYDPSKNGSSHGLLKLLGVALPPEIPEDQAVKLLRKTMYRLRQARDKLPQYNTIDDAVTLIRKSRKIMVLTGAGISVSCGIPDFRSPNGLYANLKREGKYDLDDPQQMFDIDYFKLYPEVFYSFASSIYPSNFIPSPCHRFVKLLENRNQLLRNYTQNIDNIESRVGLRRIFQCHGSFATASCIVCRNKVPGWTLESNIFSHTIPWCDLCTKRQNKRRPSNTGRQGSGSGASGSSKPVKKKRKSGWDGDDDDDGRDDAVRHIMKPDITFFGEKLHSNFDDLFVQDIKRADFDLLLIIGTSLKVAPVADIVYRVPHSIPQVLINKTPVVHGDPDIILLGDADEIVQYLCARLGKAWVLPPALAEPKVKVDTKTTTATTSTVQSTDGATTSTTRTSTVTSVATTSTSSAAKGASTSSAQGGAKRGTKGAKASPSESNRAPTVEPTRLGASHVWLFPGAEPGALLQAQYSLVDENTPSTSTALQSNGRNDAKQSATMASGKSRKTKTEKTSQGQVFLGTGSDDSSLTSLDDDDVEPNFGEVTTGYYTSDGDDEDPLGTGRSTTTTTGVSTPLAGLSTSTLTLPEERDLKRMRMF